MLIGADPELGLKSQDGADMDVSRVLEACHSLDNETKLSVDGDGATGEIRPDAAEGWEELTENIVAIMTPILQISSAEGIEIWGGGWPLHRSIGGHIHISDERLEMFDGLPRSLVNHLDALVGWPLLKIMPTAQRRAEGSYGRLGNWRVQSYGRGHHEYRSPPSWLMSQEITRAALALAWGTVNWWLDTYLDRGGAPMPEQPELCRAIVLRWADDCFPRDILAAASPVLSPLEHEDFVNENATEGWGYKVSNNGGAYGSPRDANCTSIASKVHADRVTYIYGLRGDRGKTVITSEEVVTSPALIELGVEVEHRTLRPCADGILSIGLPSVLRQDVEKAAAVAQALVDAARQETPYVPLGKKPSRGEGRERDGRLYDEDEDEDEEEEYCYHCGEPLEREDGQRVQVRGDSDGDYVATWCSYCVHDYATVCAHCRSLLARDLIERPTLAPCWGCGLNPLTGEHVPGRAEWVRTRAPSHCGAWSYIPRCQCCWCVETREAGGRIPTPMPPFNGNCRCDDCIEHARRVRRNRCASWQARTQPRDNQGRFTPRQQPTPVEYNTFRVHGLFSTASLQIEEVDTCAD